MVLLLSQIKRVMLVSLIPYVTDFSEQRTQWCRASSEEVMQVYRTEGVQFCLLSHCKRISQRRAPDYLQGLTKSKSASSVRKTPVNNQQSFYEKF